MRKGGCVGKEMPLEAARALRETRNARWWCLLSFVCPPGCHFVFKKGADQIVDHLISSETIAPEIKSAILKHGK